MQGRKRTSLNETIPRLRHLNTSRLWPRERLEEGSAGCCNLLQLNYVQWWLGKFLGCAACGWGQFSSYGFWIICGRWGFACFKNLNSDVLKPRIWFDMSAVLLCVPWDGVIGGCPKGQTAKNLATQSGSSWYRCPVLSFASIFAYLP